MGARRTPAHIVRARPGLWFRGRDSNPRLAAYEAVLAAISSHPDIPTLFFDPPGSGGDYRADRTPPNRAPCTVRPIYGTQALKRPRFRVFVPPCGWLRGYGISESRNSVPENQAAGLVCQRITEVRNRRIGVPENHRGAQSAFPVNGKNGFFSFEIFGAPVSGFDPAPLRGPHPQGGRPPSA